MIAMAQLIEDLENKKLGSLDAFEAFHGSVPYFGESPWWDCLVGAQEGKMGAASDLHTAFLAGWDWDVYSSGSATIIKGETKIRRTAAYPSLAWALCIVEAVIDRENRERFNIARAHMSENARRAPVQSTWKHRKSGAVYHIERHSLRESDLARLVTYHANDGSVPWTRPADEFFDGRFERVDS